MHSHATWNHNLSDGCEIFDRSLYLTSVCTLYYTAVIGKFVVLREDCNLGWYVYRSFGNTYKQIYMVSFVNNVCLECKHKINE